MKIKILVLTTLLITGCDDQSYYDNQAHDILSMLSYVKDKHGICYAVRGGVNPSLTTVPCEKVNL